MTKISIKILAFLIPCSALISSCNNGKSNTNDSKAVLDTVSLNNKSFELAYQDGNKIVATSIDTMKQISFGGATNPAISPDGKKLAYTVTESAGGRGIWVADLENKSQIKLQVNSKNFDEAAWSPDGNTIAFNIYYKENHWKIGIIKADNTGFTVLDSVSQNHVYAPTWKNNQEIIGHDLTNLYTFNQAGKLTDTQRIADLIGTALLISSSNCFFYSKNGQKLIFTAANNEIIKESNDPMEGVYILDLNNKKISRISPEGMNAPDLFVTADDRIFYSGAEKPYSQNKIYVSDLSGTGKLISERGSKPTGALKQ